MKLASLAAALGAALLLAPATVDAHSGVQSYVYVSIFDDGLEGRVEYPVADLAEALDLELPDDAGVIDDLPSDVVGSIVGYTDQHLAMSDDGEPWRLQYEGTVSYLDTESGGYVLVPFEVAEDFGDTPRSWTVTYDGIIEFNPERDALLLIEDDWESATFRNEGEHLLGFSVGNETQLVDVESVSTTESLREIARRGSVSVDRSAIVLAALIAVVAAAGLGTVSRGAWRGRLTEIAVRVGLVVVGSTLSLWAIGLLGVGVGTRAAMVAGAAGVLLAAGTWWLRDHAARSATLGVGVLAGVMIGASFVEQQLDRSRPVLSLVAYELGASLTLAVVAAMLTPLVLIVGSGRRATIVGTVTVAIAALAGVIWIVEGAFGFTFPLRTLELRVADAVTSPLLIAIVTAIVGAAAFVRATSRQRDTTAVDDTEQDPPERIEVR